MASTKSVLLLVHPFFRPDLKKPRSQTEVDVLRSIRRLGYRGVIVPVENDFRELEGQISKEKPFVVFNLLEEFRGEGVYDFHIVSLLESLGLAYTGCNPRGLVLSRNKLWVMHLASAAGIKTPHTRMVESRRQPEDMHPPFILKLNTEHASLGLTQKSVAKDWKQALQLAKQMKGRWNSDVIAQDFIVGRELSVSVLGNRQALTFHPWELHLQNGWRVATEKIKFDAALRRRLGITARPFAGASEVIRKAQTVSRKIYGSLQLSGYARCDFRLSPSGELFLIDVNANPNLASTEDFARSAKRYGLTYDETIERIIKLARSYQPVH